MISGYVECFVVEETQLNILGNGKSNGSDHGILIISITHLTRSLRSDIHHYSVMVVGHLHKADSSISQFVLTAQALLPQ